MPRPRTSLIIPNYNGATLLSENLPSVVEAAERHGAAEVVVVDDGSTDESASLVADRFDGVRLVKLGEHLGFVAAINRGVQRADGRLVVLLNSDVQVELDFLDPLEQALTDDTFAVSCRSLTEDDLNEGLSLAFFEEGDLVVVQPGIEAPDPRHDRRCTNFHASGGFSAFDRHKFLALGGLDPLFHPFYWEDVDLCYRAWKRGWRVVYEPESRVRHHAHGTISCYFTADEVADIYQTNKHIFVLKNISDPKYLRDYFRRLTGLLRGPADTDDQRRQGRAAFWALKRWREVLSRRPAAQRDAVVTDPEVFARSANVPC